jgi:hypothetical protein
MYSLPGILGRLTDPLSQGLALNMFLVVQHCRSNYAALVVFSRLASLVNVESNLASALTVIVWSRSSANRPRQS